MSLALLLLGGVMLYFGAEWLVGGASRLALSLRVPQLIVGLTVVAYGTSAPEVIVGVQAAHGGHGDVALGNVLGSNIFNVLLCLGASGLVGTIRGEPAALVADLGVLIAMTIAGLVFMRTARTFRRWEGAVLLGGYVAFLGYLVAQST